MTENQYRAITVSIFLLISGGYLWWLWDTRKESKKQSEQSLKIQQFIYDQMMAADLMRRNGIE